MYLNSTIFKNIENGLLMTGWAWAGKESPYSARTARKVDKDP